jgi:hypothetical protein
MSIIQQPLKAEKVHTPIRNCQNLLGGLLKNCNTQILQILETGNPY